MRILREKLRILCAALVSVLAFSACVSAQKNAPVFDNHVHIMAPRKIKTFCGIDPLRDFALEEARRCFEQLKIDGLKLHFNASQVYLTEPEHLAKVRPVFTFAAENGLPVLLHFDNSHPKFGETDVNLLVDEILLKIKPVKLVLAHFGTSGGFNEKTKTVLSAFIDRFRQEPKLARHQVLFDISAVALDKDSDGVAKLTDEQFAEVKEYAVRLGFDRIAFGTDYPLYSTADYLRILKDRVKFSDREIIEILSEKRGNKDEKE